MNPGAKASLATVLFFFFALCALLFWVPLGPLVLPHAIFYGMLVVNTFFSVRFWAELQPRDMYQTTVDLLLVVLYGALAFSIGQPIIFAVAALCLFVVASLKYVFMRGRIAHTELLKRKIRIDSIGALMCTALLAGTLAGYEIESAWALALVFTTANVYLLHIRPMYRL